MIHNNNTGIRPRELDRWEAGLISCPYNESHKENYELESLKRAIFR